MHIGQYFRYWFILHVAAFVLLPLQHVAQSTEADSLRVVISSPARDTGAINARIRLAHIYIRNRRLEDGKKLADEALKMAQDLKFTRGIFNAMMASASYYADKNEFVLADTMYRQIIAFAAKNGNTRGLMQVNNSMGLNYFNRGEYDLALEHHIRAWELAEKEKVHAYAAIYLSNMARIYSIYGDYDKAIQYTEKAIAYERAINGKKESIIIRLINLSNYYNEAGRYANGILHAQEGLRLNAAGSNNSTWDAYLRNNLGHAYLKSGKALLSIPEFERSANVFEELGDSALLAMSYANLAMARVETGDIAKAQENIGRSFRLQADSSLDPEYRRYRLDVAAAVNEKNGRPAEALRYYKAARTINDSINRKEQFDKVAELHRKFETRLKEDSIRFGRQELQQQRIINEQTAHISGQKSILLFVSLAMILALGITSTLVYINYRRKQEANRMLENKNIIIAQKNNENELLLAEIHHRVKNNLQVISSLLSLQGKSISDESARSAIEAGRMRVKSMELVHTMLYESSDFSFIEISCFTRKLVINLCDIYDIDPKRFRAELGFPPIKLDIDTALPIALILNETIVNSFKHSYGKTNDVFIITADLREKDSALHLLIADNGIGSPGQLPGSNNSFGFRLIQLLTRQLAGTFEITNANGLHYRFVFTDYKRID